ncbi:MAG: sodium/solute symporter [Desulfitobacteriaceae bacterium]|nr:sodium/solute symporter [Desulfitobacteriaceae bacterium]MDD4752938.1 sodium/solute symporter [Desulfitobacteriaceae bacterium]
MKIFIVLIYVAALLGMGYVSMKKTKTLNDFFLGNRSVGPWVSAFAYGTTYFSAVLFVGYAGKVGWGFGLSSLWIVVGNALLGSLLAWKVLARRTRAMTVRLGAITMPEFLEKRYNSQAFRIIGALIIFIFFIPYSASVYMGLSYFFESIFGIPYAYALIFMACVTAVYLIMGGYFAVTMTSFIQGIIMIIGVIIMLFFIVGSETVGGWTNVVPALSAIDPKLVAPVGPAGGISLFSMVILTSLGAWGLPQMVQKFYAIKNEKVINTAAWVTTGFSLLMAFGAYFTGSLSHLFFENLDRFGGNPDLITPTIIQETLPAAIALLILLLVFSASMSTLASLVLVSSSSIAVDLVQVVKPNADKGKSMMLMRVLCLVFVGFSLYLAVKPNAILSLMAFSWGTVAGSFLAPYVYGLFSRRVTSAGAWAGLITGFTISVVFSIIYPEQIPLAGSLAMLVPLIVVPAVSAITSPLPAKHLEWVFGDKIKSDSTKEGKNWATSNLR